MVFVPLVLVIAQVGCGFQYLSIVSLEVQGRSEGKTDGKADGKEKDIPYISAQQMHTSIDNIPNH